MGVFSRSWQLTKESFSILRQEKEILTFPILSIFFSLIFLAFMILPFLLDLFFDFLGFSFSGVLWFVLIFFSYLGLAIIATFFNVCVVYTAAIRFSGENARFWKTIGYAFSKFHLIFMWGVVSATVGFLLHLLENFAQKAGPIGKILLILLNRILGLIWSILTLFVVPVMVYENLGPFKSIKRSVDVLKKTWGESLIKAVGMGLINFLAILSITLVFIPLIAFSFFLGVVPLILVLFGLYFIIVFGVVLIFNTAGKVFDTALYVYAVSGQVVGYTPELVQGAFKQKNSKLLPM